MDLLGTLQNLWETSGFYLAGSDWRQIVMILVGCLLLYLGIVKKFEPLLLVGIAFGTLLTNLPGGGLYHPELWDAVIAHTKGYGDVLREGGLLDILYIGVKAGVYPSLIFLGVGAMTDFGPLLANPKSLLLGAAAQLGVYMAFILAVILGFTGPEAASIGIIGGADGPTAIFLTTKLAPHLLGAIAIAAYSYMALIPLIQPPIMRALTTKKERETKMDQLRPVSKTEKIVFPVVVAVFVILLLPSTAPLIGCLMLGNLMRECGVVERLSDTAERADEYRHHLPVRLRRRDHRSGSLPDCQHAEDRAAGPAGVLLLHGRRRAAGQNHVQGDRRQDQPADRLCGRVCRTHGRPCFPGGGPEGEPLQLPADARHGAQRGRRDRLRHRGRLPAGGFRRLSFQKGRGGCLVLFLYMEPEAAFGRKGVSGARRRN